VDTRRLTAEVRLSRWSGIIRERAESGKTVKQWCSENGICAKTYYYWQRKLREAVLGSLEEQKRPQMPSAGKTSFVEVRTTNPPSRHVLPEGSPAAQIQIEISGMRITAGTGYPPETLASLLRGLAPLC